MEYRKLPNGGRKVSTVGIGSVHLHEMEQPALESLIDHAAQNGVNLIDLCMSYFPTFPKLAKALEGRRKDFIYQMHLGMTYPGGQYLRTRELEPVKRAFEEQLNTLGTDYADIAFIHCVDEQDDFEDVMRSGVYEYALEMKKQGVVHHIGFASHTIDICEQFIELDGIDTCMFSINPAYDFDPVENLAFEGVTVTSDTWQNASRRRYAFYDECARRGIGIQVMKAYAGGLLLDEKNSPLGQAMTIPQCLQYALDRPAVLSCLLGVASQAHLDDALAYYESREEERDYAFVSGLRHSEMGGTCVYCNHCLPCPANIDIAAVHKYLDLAMAGDKMAAAHYRALSRGAGDCIQCGACEAHCPFGVNVRQKMRQAVELLG